MGIKSSLYKLALWYIGRVYQDSEFEIKRRIKNLNEYERLTYINESKYYLHYGADCIWSKLPSYYVLDNAIQKLGKYEDKEINDLIIRESKMSDKEKILQYYDENNVVNIDMMIKGDE